MARRKARVAFLVLLIVSSLVVARVVSMPPQYYESKVIFTTHLSQLDELIVEFDAIAGARSITLVDSSLVVDSVFGENILDSLPDSQKKKILRLMQSVGTPRLRRTELGNAVVVGSQERFGKFFQIEFVTYRDLANLSPPDCMEDPSGEFGVCSFPLQGRWALRYEWVPAVGRGAGEDSR